MTLCSRGKQKPSVVRKRKIVSVCVCVCVRAPSSKQLFYHRGSLPACCTSSLQPHTGSLLSLGRPSIWLQSTNNTEVKLLTCASCVFKWRCLMEAGEFWLNQLCQLSLTHVSESMRKSRLVQQTVWWCHSNEPNPTFVDMSPNLCFLSSDIQNVLPLHWHNSFTQSRL